MRKLIFLSVLLLGVSWLVAQSAPSQSTKSSTGTETSVQGCLGGSEGSYTLTDKSGTIYQLSGDTSKLKEHVGHEVKITGSAGAASAASGGTSGGMGQGGSSSKTIEVTSVKHVAKSCPAAGEAK